MDINKLSDLDYLLRLWQEGEAKAFDQIYLLTRVRLYVLALSIIKDQEAAQDVVQELFIDLWKHERNLGIEKSFLSYLIRSIRNRSYNYLSKKATYEKRDHNFRQTRDLWFLASDKLEDRALRELLENAIDELPPMAKKVFKMHYLDQKSHAEIAQTLSISLSTVSNHMTRALKQLREYLKEINK